MQQVELLKEEESYTIPNQWPQAYKRLKLFEKLSDPITLKLLSQMIECHHPETVLEVGAGGGSVTKWLCENTHSQITALDLDTIFLDKLEYSNLIVLEQDIQTFLPKIQYDIIHCRTVLIHLEKREQVISHLISMLKPGGRILLEEPDFTTHLPLSGDLKKKALYDKVVDAIEHTQTERGMRYRFGGELLGIMQKNGLTDLLGHGETKIAQGRDDTAKFFKFVYLQLQESVIEHSQINEYEFKQFLKLFEDQDFYFRMYLMMSVLGRKPD